MADAVIFLRQWIWKRLSLGKLALLMIAYFHILWYEPQHIPSILVFSCFLGFCFITTMIKLIILIICFGRFASYRVYSLCSQRNLSKSKSKSNQINLEIIVFFTTCAFCTITWLFWFSHLFNLVNHSLASMSSKLSVLSVLSVWHEIIV